VGRNRSVEDAGEIVDCLELRRDAVPLAWLISDVTEQRRTLELLASSRFGINEELLVHAHVFSRHVLAELVRAGFAIAERHVLAGDRATEVVRALDSSPVDL
jgi:hypothetical protein